MDIMLVIMSIFFGILPESIFLALFIIFSKNIKEKWILLYSLIFSASVLSAFVFVGMLWHTFVLIFLIYFILWLLYRSHIIDVFLISVSFFYIAIIGISCFYLIDNYLIALVINRILLFLPIIVFRKYLNNWYNLYKSLWNRKDGNKIKSITLRNCSVVMLNILMLLLNMAAMSLNIYIGG